MFKRTFVTPRRLICCSMTCDYCQELISDLLPATDHLFGIKVCHEHVAMGKRDNNAWLHSQNAVRVKDFASAYPAIMTPTLNMGGFIVKKDGAWLLPLDKPTPIVDATLFLSLNIGFYIADYFASLQPKAETKAAVAAAELARAEAEAAASAKEAILAARSPAAKAAERRQKAKAKAAAAVPTPNLDTLLKKLTPQPHQLQRRRSRSRSQEQEQEQEQDQEPAKQQLLPLQSDLEGWTTVG